MEIGEIPHETRGHARHATETRDTRPRRDRDATDTRGHATDTRGDATETRGHTMPRETGAIEMQREAVRGAEGRHVLEETLNATRTRIRAI